MKNKTIFSLPPYLYDFSTPAEDNPRTIAKLKVFYKGETADGRVFTPEFSELIAKTLPNTPVVAFYDEEEKDFKGHNSIQHIYGVVSADAEYGFEVEEDSDKEWLITDVILYTDRVDNIGEVAKKIVGHKHSLELDPKTTTWKFIKEDGKRKIQFLDGKLVGLSVVGTNQKPAFADSEFYTEELTEMKERFVSFLNFLDGQKDGGENETNMDMSKDKINKNEVIQAYLDFLALGYTQKLDMAWRALQSRFNDEAVSIGIQEMTDNNIVYTKYDWNSGDVNHYKIDYTLAEGEKSITLAENEIEVFAVYLTTEEIESLNAGMNTGAEGEADGSESDNEEEGTETNSATASSGEEGAGTGEAAEGEQEDGDNDDTANEGEAQPNEELEAMKVVLAETNKVLQTYITKEKEALHASFKDVLDSKVLAEIDITKYDTVEELNVALSLAFTKAKKNAHIETPLSFDKLGDKTTHTENDRENLKALVKKYAKANK